LFDLSKPEELESVGLCQPILAPVALVESGAGTITVHAECNDGFRQFVIDGETLEVSNAIASGGQRSALSADGTVLFHQILDQDAFVETVERFDTRTGEYGEPLEGLCRHTFGAGNGCLEFPNAPFPDWANDLEISSGGSMLAMAGDISDGVTVWDLTTNEILATPRVPHLTEHPDRALSVAFSPDDSLLAASFGWGSPELWLISTETWEPITSYESETQAPTEELVFTPDGRTLIATDHVAGGVGRIVFLDGETLEPVAEIRDAHDAAITQLDISPDGSMLASAGVDGVVRVWDVATRALKHEIPVSRDEKGVGGVDFLTNERLAVVDDNSGQLHTFSIDPSELLAIARSRVTRGFTDTECTKYNLDPCPTLEDIQSG
jgi:WD40 repeat protein